MEWRLFFKVHRPGRNLKEATALVDGIPGVGALALDITGTDSIETALATIQETHGSLDVLINNAAAFFDAGNTVIDTDLAMVREAFDTNTLGAWRLTVAALPLLRRSAGGANPVEDAVPDVLWVADYAANPTTGGFFRNRKPLDW